MPTVPKTHEDNQISICGLCLGKSKLLRNITDTTLERIRKLGVFEDYNKTEQECGKDWTWLPQKICNPCHGSLTKAWDNEKKRQDEGYDAEALHRFISHVDYTDLKPPTKMTRDHPMCECSLCEIGRMKAKEYSTEVIAEKCKIILLIHIYFRPWRACTRFSTNKFLPTTCQSTRAIPTMGHS